MKTEKWAIYAILTLILIIAAFNMVSALTMLVLEKKQDISILLVWDPPFTDQENIFIGRPVAGHLRHLHRHRPGNSHLFIPAKI